MRASRGWILGVFTALVVAAAWWWLADGEPALPVPIEAPSEVGGGPAADEATGAGAGPEVRVHLAVRLVEEFVPPPGVLYEQLVGGWRRFGDPNLKAEHDLLLTGYPGGPRLVRAPFVDPERPRQFSVGPDATVRGRVLDAAGAPLVGAMVWVGAVDGAGGLVETTTGDDGAFAVPTASGVGIPVVVRAPGCAAVLQIVDLVGGSNEVVFRLTPSATLRVQVVGLGAPAGVGRVVVTPLDRVTSELSSYPFVLASVLGGVPLDALGRATISDLPIGCEVGVVLVHPATPIAAPRPVVLRERGAEVIFQVRAQSLRAARVVDGEGRPIAGARILAGPGLDDLPASRRLLPQWLGAVGMFVARSDAAGAFEIADGAVPWQVSAFGHAGRRLEPSAELVLPPWRGGEPSITLRAPEGAGEWLGEADLGGGVRATLAAGTDWTLSLPKPGRYEVEAATYVRGELRGRAGPLLLDATGPVRVAAPRR